MDLKNNFQCTLPAIRSFDDALKPIHKAQFTLDDLFETNSDADFERDVEEPEQLEWIEDARDGLLQIERDDDNQLDYNEESDDGSEQDENEVSNLPPIQLQRQRGQIFRSFDVEYAFG